MRVQDSRAVVETESSGGDADMLTELEAGGSNFEGRWPHSNVAVVV